MEIMREKTKIDKLCGQSGIASVLLYLLDHDYAILSDFIYDLRIHGTTITRCLTLLQQLECIKEEREVYNRRVSVLTEKGKKIAKKMKEIKEILEEEQ